MHLDAARTILRKLRLVADDRHKVCVILLILVGALFRVWSFGSIPPGLNQDEASIGYEAYALLNYGIDRHGNHNPVHLVSWGDGQNALYAYLCMPFIWLFGLNTVTVRIPNFILGVVALAMFYLVARELRNRRFACCCLFLLVISPWHIMLSRWGLESNIFPVIFLSAIYCYHRGLKDQRFIMLFGGLAAISLYAYGVAYIFVPVCCGVLALGLLCNAAIQKRTVLLAGWCALVVALPIILFVVINLSRLPAIEAGLFSIPRLGGMRTGEISMTGDHPVAQTAANWARFGNFFAMGADDCIWNSISPFGWLYPLSIPLVLVGLVQSCYRQLWRPVTGAKTEFAMLVWMWSAFLLAGLINNANVNRVNIIFLPSIYFVAVGLYWLRQRGAWFFNLCLVAYCMYFGAFAYTYFGTYRHEVSGVFKEGLGEAIRYATKSAPGEIVMDRRIHEAHIYVLFFNRIDPHDFIRANQNGKFPNGRLGAFRFETPDSPTPRQPTSYVLEAKQAEMFSTNSYRVTKFKNYAVAIPCAGDLTASIAKEMALETSASVEKD